MVQNLSNALLITLIGMGLVFVAIFLLWGLMALIVLIKDGKAEEEAAPPDTVSTQVATSEAALSGTEAPGSLEPGLKQAAAAEAAAVAVAVALALEQVKKPVALETRASLKAGVAPETTAVSAAVPSVSAWQAFHRTHWIDVKQMKGHGR